jgi:c-di-GMP phosphodiesterase
MPNTGQTGRDIYLARQPIFDRDQSVYAYKVLFRNSAENRADVKDNNTATSELLLNAFVEIGLDSVVGTQKAFVNFAREFLVGKYPMPMATERLGIEILKDVVVDDELVAGVSSLVAQGCTLALDDLVDHDNRKPLLEMASIVKLDLSSIPRKQLPAQVEKFRKYPVKLLAERVETLDDFEHCKTLGFDLFQGFFLSRPQMIKGREQRANQAVVLKLYSRLCDPQVSIDELERLVRTDPALCYKLLRYINSLKFALPKRIRSLRQAIVLLGIQGVRSLVMLVGLAKVSQKPTELLMTSIIRALMCERLAEIRRYREPHAYFTAGLISSLDAVLDMPLAEVVQSLHIDEELKDAILCHTGPIGKVIRCSIAQERGDWTHIPFAELKNSEIREAYLAAIREARAMWSELSK